MVVRKSNVNDIPAIMQIVNHAKQQMHKNGIDQWQDGYPNEATILQDIQLNCSYVVQQDQTIVGTVCLMISDEVSYHHIENGRWLNQQPYLVIHRIAVMQRGMAGILLDEAIHLAVENDIYNIRVDTHEDNIAMRRFLSKNGFQECGVIYLENHSKRIAYQKILE